MVCAQPHEREVALTRHRGLDDFEVEFGMHVMSDCNGTLALYCWDGGKTWVVGGEPAGDVFSSRRRHTRSVSAFLPEPLFRSDRKSGSAGMPRPRSEERFSRNAETDLVCRLLLEKKKHEYSTSPAPS